MTEKRYKRLVSSIDYYYCIDTNDDKGLTEEDMLNRLNEQDKLIRKLRTEVEVHKHPLFSTRQAEEKIERYESDLRMCREKALYWRNKAEDIFGDMRTNVELKRENEQLKQDRNEMFIRERDTKNEWRKLKEENEQLKGEVKRLKCINKQLEERLDKDIALNMDCGDVCMMEKTKLIFKNDVMEGYVHYINFKRDFSGALEIFKKYILPIECNISIDANKDWLILTFSYGEEDEDYLEILKEEWDTVTTFLKEENIQFAYPSQHDDWGIVILIDDFVEYVVKKYVLEGDVE